MTGGPWTVVTHGPQRGEKENKPLSSQTHTIKNQLEAEKKTKHLPQLNQINSIWCSVLSSVHCLLEDV